MKDGIHLSPTNDARPLRHHELDPSLGRWTRQDPLGYVDGSSPYQYLKANPLVHQDPWGLTTIKNVDGANWETPRRADHVTTHMPNDLNADPDVPRRQLGPHLHSTDGRKFFPADGVILTREGRYISAPRSFQKQFASAVESQPGVARALRRAGVIPVGLIAAFIPVAAAQGNESLRDDLVKALERVHSADRDGRGADLEIAIQDLASHINQLMGGGFREELIQHGIRQALER